MKRLHSLTPFSPLVLLAAVLALTGCGHKSSPASSPLPDPPAAPVKVLKVESKNEPITEDVTGTIRAKLRATLEAKVSGRIEKLPVVLGQKVAAGQLVARLDAPEINARVDQAAAALQQTERDWTRVSSLFQQQAVTHSEYDAAESRQRVAKAALAEARAMLAYVEIAAPFDSVVTRKWVDVGDLATPGKPLVVLEDPTNLQLEADVPEAIASRIQLGGKLVVRAGAQQVTAPVSEIAPVADPDSRTVRVKLDLPTATNLMPGQFARLVVPLGESASIRVPARAVLQRGQLDLVFVVSNARAVLHLVKTGKRVGDELEILSGLQAGETVVIDGADQLIDGQPVTLQ